MVGDEILPVEECESKIYPALLKNEEVKEYYWKKKGNEYRAIHNFTY